MAGFISAELQNAWRTRPKLGTLAGTAGSRLQTFALYAGGVATVLLLECESLGRI